MRKKLIGIILLFILLLLCACKKEPKPVIIGLIEPLNGPHAVGGVQEQNGVMIAKDLRPMTGDRPIEIAPLDIGHIHNDDEKIKELVEVFLKEQKPIAIIGPYGSKNTASVLSALDESKIPLISPTSTRDSLANYQNFYRLIYTDNLQSTALATFAVEQLNAHRVGVLVEENNDYAINLATEFEKVFGALCGKDSAVERILYPAGTQDFNHFITTISKFEPDLIFAPGNAETSLAIITQAHRLGVNQPFLGGDTWENPIFLSQQDENITSAIYFSALQKKAPIDDIALNRFTNMYFQRYSQSASLNSELAYDAYNLIIDAIENAESTESEKLNEAIKSTLNFAGISGNISFNDTNNSKRNVTIMTILNGQFISAEISENSQMQNNPDNTN